MAKVIHCPNCNAEIRYRGYNQRVNCEYCRSSVVISVNEVLMNELYQQNGEIIDNASKEEISQMKQDLLIEEYKVRNKAWIKKLVIVTLVTLLLSFFIGFMSLNVFEGNISAGVTAVVLWIVAAVLGFGKPVSPLKRDISSKITAGIIVYIVTYIALALGSFAAIIIDGMINPENKYTVTFGNGTYEISDLGL